MAQKFFGQVWENSGRNPSYPQKSPAPTTYGVEFSKTLWKSEAIITGDSQDVFFWARFLPSTAHVFRIRLDMNMTVERREAYDGNLQTALKKVADKQCWEFATGSPQNRKSATAEQTFSLRICDTQI